jgi:AcrR family transcriptional regulator
MSPREERGRDAVPAPQRILEAAARSIVTSGAAAMSLSEVAAEAAVSKALIHYHYHDKDSLLVRLVDHTSHELTNRERSALDGQHSPLAVDSIWDWLVGELERGSLRVLLEVSQYRSAPVQAAARRASALRRATTTDTVNRLFEILELRPRVPADLIAEVVVAFVDGLVMDAALGDERATRVAFDVFWLALLNLAE